VVRRWTVIVLASLLAVACGSASGSATPSALPAASPSATVAPEASADPAAVGRAFVQALSEDQDTQAQGMEDPAMLAAAPGPKLAQLWQGFVSEYGTFQSIGQVTTSAQAPYTVDEVPVTFASARVTLTVTVTSSGQVGGLHVIAAATASPTA
jgi:Protein of unknown function (DUF3887)